MCATCEGIGQVGGRNIAEMSALQVSELAGVVRGIDAPQVGPILQALAQRLDNLVSIGLGYLSLDRESSNLSGGESQRVKMVRHLGSSLTDITYVFDEPSVGLHSHDVGALTGLMMRLCDKGNTVLIVEHKPAMIAIAHRRLGSTSTIVEAASTLPATAAAGTMIRSSTWSNQGM